MDGHCEDLYPVAPQVGGIWLPNGPTTLDPSRNRMGMAKEGGCEGQDPGVLQGHDFTTLGGSRGPLSRPQPRAVEGLDRFSTAIRIIFCTGQVSVPILSPD